jgi:hypothetical protein
MATIILRPKQNQHSGGTKPDIEVDLQTYQNMMVNGMINRFRVVKTVAINKAEKQADIEKFTTVIQQKLTPTTYEALVKEYRAIKGTDNVREKELLLKAKFLNKESKFIEKELKNYE